MTAFARQLIEEAFAPLSPEQAQHELPVDRFVEIVAPLKPRLIHHPRTLELLRTLLCDLSGDAEGAYFDVPRMRVATSHNYLNAGGAYPLHPPSRHLVRVTPLPAELVAAGLSVRGRKLVRVSRALLDRARAQQLA